MTACLLTADSWHSHVIAARKFWCIALGVALPLKRVDNWEVKRKKMKNKAKQIFKFLANNLLNCWKIILGMLNLNQWSILYYSLDVLMTCRRNLKTCRLSTADILSGGMVTSTHWNHSTTSIAHTMYRTIAQNQCLYNSLTNIIFDCTVWVKVKFHFRLGVAHISKLKNSLSF